MLFPQVSGENLERRKFIFPDDFAKNYNLLIIAFTREQQTDVDTWSSVVRRLTREHEDLAFYELPILKEFTPIYRWWINTGMRAGIPERKMREATITLYLDKEAFKKALELPNEEQIYVLLVKHTGEILWRVDGPWTPEKENEIETFMVKTA